MAKKLGIEHKVFYRASALSAVPEDASDLTGFTEQTVVSAVSATKSPTEVDMSDRSSLRDQTRFIGEAVEYQIQIIRDPGNAFYVNLERARRDSTEITLVFSSGAISDSEIMDAGNWSVGQHSWGEARKESAMATFTLKPADEYYANLLPSIS